MVRIKAVFPYNYYLLRKIKIKAGGQIIARIGHKQVIELEDVPSQHLTFKLDYHKTSIELPDTEKDVHIILYFDLRPYFPFNVTDIMFRNALRAKVVDKQEFDSFDEKFYNSSTSQPVGLNTTFYYSLVAGILISLEFILVPFMQQPNPGPVTNFAFIVGLITLAGFIAMFFNRKKLSRASYSFRILAFGILSVVLIGFLKLSINLKIISLIVAITLILVAAYGLKEKP